MTKPKKLQWEYYEGLPPITFTMNNEEGKPEPCKWIPLPGEFRDGKHLVRAKVFDGKGGEMTVEFTVGLVEHLSVGTKFATADPPPDPASRSSRRIAPRRPAL